MAQSEPTALFAAEMRKAIEGMAQTRELIHSFMNEHARVRYATSWPPRTPKDWEAKP
jgi:hypothetical protein